MSVLGVMGAPLLIILIVQDVKSLFRGEIELAIFNRTIKNKTKIDKLKSEHILPSHNILYPEVTVPFLREMLGLYREGIQIGSILFKISNILINKKIEGYEEYDCDICINIPEKSKLEYDLIGSVYQYITSKDVRLSKGSFYTNQELVNMMVADLDISEQDIIFDPACGSGNLLFNDKVTNPEQIIGVDFDELAILCCKTNYYIKFGNNAPAPKIYTSDFFEFAAKNEIQCDYILSNPPFGANIESEYLSGYLTLDTEKGHYEFNDSLSLFMAATINLAKKKALFILPESVVNVKKYSSIRKWIIDENYLENIITYNSEFSGTLFPILVFTLNAHKENEDFYYDSEKISMLVIKEVPFYYLRPLNNKDEEILKKVFEKNDQSLKESVFGLGVVTGDNKTKLFSAPGDGLEPIITGKDVFKNRIAPPKKYIHFDRKELQQVAPDELYRSKEKVVYKTVSRDMFFAIDYSGSLTLNSANFFIPKNLTISTKCLVALLNSSLYEKVNKLLFGENKISRTNLENLPIPSIDKTIQEEIENLLDTEEYSKIDSIILNLFNIEEL